jgi:hypothetical protein
VPRKVTIESAASAIAILEYTTAKPEAAPTLGALRSRGLYAGVVSNADDEWLEPALLARGIAPANPTATSPAVVVENAVTCCSGPMAPPWRSARVSHSVVSWSGWVGKPGMERRL